MSIAVSAIVRPSSRLRLLQAGFAASVLGLAAATAGLAWPVVCSAVGACAGLAALAGLRRNAKARQLDISGVGQIRLTVYQGMAPQIAEQGGGADGAPPALQLMAGSTLWPGLLLLRLRRADGGVERLLLLPDSVAAGAFRPLAVALRAIAARGGGAERARKLKKF